MVRGWSSCWSSLTHHAILLLIRALREDLCLTFWSVTTFISIIVLPNATSRMVKLFLNTISEEYQCDFYYFSWVRLQFSLSKTALILNNLAIAFLSFSIPNFGHMLTKSWLFSSQHRKYEKEGGICFWPLHFWFGPWFSTISPVQGEVSGFLHLFRPYDINSGCSAATPLWQTRHHRCLGFCTL